MSNILTPNILNVKKYIYGTNILFFPEVFLYFTTIIFDSVENIDSL